MHLNSVSFVWGYISGSAKFRNMLDSWISFASGSQKVVTKEERFNIGLASVQVSLVTIAFAALAEIPSAGNCSGISKLN
jgi:hypothetical protein